MRSISIVILTFSVFHISYSNADNSCAIDLKGIPLCAPAGGTAVETISGVVCAPGKCVIDNQGHPKCSSLAGGGATLDYQGNVFCVEGCISPSLNFCTNMKGNSK